MEGEGGETRLSRLSAAVDAAEASTRGLKRKHRSALVTADVGDAGGLNSAGAGDADRPTASEHAAAAIV
eukprot:3954669-Prymnesium_polylepis.1